MEGGRAPRGSSVVDVGKSGQLSQQRGQQLGIGNALEDDRRLGSACCTAAAHIYVYAAALVQISQAWKLLAQKSPNLRVQYCRSDPNHCCPGPSIQVIPHVRSCSATIPHTAIVILWIPSAWHYFDVPCKLLYGL